MKILEGVKVLDFTTNAAGPIVGSYFADYGAEVIKVEVPGGRGRQALCLLRQRYEKSSRTYGMRELSAQTPSAAELCQQRGDELAVIRRKAVMRGGHDGRPIRWCLC